MLYIERAKIWVEKGDSVDIGTIESTIQKFSCELKALDSSSEKCEDIRETISFLKSELLELTTKDTNTDQLLDTTEDILLDSSSLFPTEIEESEMIILSQKEKSEVLKRIKNDANFVSLSKSSE